MAKKLQKQYIFSEEVKVERKGAPNQIFQKGVSYYLNAAQVKEHQDVVSEVENTGAPEPEEATE